MLLKTIYNFNIVLRQNSNGILHRIRGTNFLSPLPINDPLLQALQVKHTNLKVQS